MCKFKASVSAGVFFVRKIISQLERGDVVAYQGYLIKIGDYTISAKKFIKADSYSAYVNMQDIDDYTDANGLLHRDAVDLKVAKIEFETPAMLTNAELSELMRNIQANYTIAKARQCEITAYIPEYDDYVTQIAYLADIKPSIYGVFDDVIKYNPIRMAFIGGVYDD